jgi:hypothetical protein
MDGQGRGQLMKPVDQQYVKDPALNQYGDCQRAVIASLMELNIAQVPHFLQEVMDGKTAEQGSLGFYGYIDSWLAERGYAMMWSHNPLLHAPDTVCQISGPSPRGNGVWHAVVGTAGGKIIHDPHPSKAGLLEPHNWGYSFLVPLDRVAVPVDTRASVTRLIDSKNPH